MNIQVLQLYTEISETENGYTDFWYDLDEIKGFYFPVTDNDDKRDVNIVCGVGSLTVKATVEISKYLMEKFVDNVG